jgi:predicted Zn finger-like uncharacterized protein
MKITCDNCGAKYSIADDKVQGKVFKIRCKKCGESIVVRGDEEHAQAAAAAVGETETKVFDYSGYKSSGGDDPVWYVAVDGGEQQGPYSGNQMREYLAAGNITPQSFVWREGFDDWKAAGDLPEFAPAPAAAPAGGLFDAAPAPVGRKGGGLFDAAPAATSRGGGLFDAAPAASSKKGGGLFDSPADDGPGDIFSAPAATPTSGGGLFGGGGRSAPAAGGGLFDGAETGGGDLFGDSGGSDDGGIFASTEAAPQTPRVSAQQAMTGQRNENSVLFSLSNLQALASDAAPAKASAAAPAALQERKPGYASNEASGLIDIRAMASSLAAEAEKADDVDEMLALGGGGFAPTLGAPVLTASQQGMSTGVKIAIAVGGVVVLAALVVVGIIVLRSGDQDKAAQENEAKIALLMKQIEEMQKSGASADQIKVMQDKLSQAQQNQPTLGGDVQPMPEESAQADKGDDKESSSKSSSRRKSDKESGSSSSSSSSSSSASASEPEAPKSTTPRKTTALDALLGGGSSTKKADPKPAASAGGSEKLTREQVVSGMNAVKASVSKCGAGKAGTMKIKALIAADGRVENATAVDEFAGTPEGACAARAVRMARFPRSAASTTVTYPFKL